MTASPVKILLVEDSPSDAALLEESLRDVLPGRFEFVHAVCWTEAAERLRQDHCDVLLLDLSLPDSAGQETLLRARAAAPHLPIVVLTGVPDEAVALDALRQGIQDYLVKGQSDGHQTARAIRYAIERHRADEALKKAEAALRESDRILREWNVELERRVDARTAQLQETIASLEEFSYSITHDLRAPLRAMRGFAQVVCEECAACTQPLAREYIQRIIASAARMDKLILDVLQYSRAARGELVLGPVDIQSLLHGIIESYPAFHAPHVQIRVKGLLPRVLGNEAALTQCFSNLLDNAVKFVAPGVHPQVHIWAQKVRNAECGARNKEAGFSAATLNPALGPPQCAPPIVRLWFEDNGIGIQKTAQERIFKLFQRLNHNYEGTGVGLAVVRKAVEKMGGKVGLESEPGQGTRFWLELRLAG